MTYIGRFAPSPTGHLHMGNFWAALVAWVRAKQEGGVCLYRLEDLDKARSRPEYIESMRGDLAWLGLDFDEPKDHALPDIKQSERDAQYKNAISQLAKHTHVFKCECTRKDIKSAGGAPHLGEGLFYPGTCRERRTELWIDGTVLRWCIEDRVIEFEDRHFGPQKVNPYHLGGDTVLCRKDGIFAYHLAVVVDDATQKISEVVRGRDLLGPTAVQIALYNALALEKPKWAHCPIVVDENNQRLEKRSGAQTLDAYRQRGVHAMMIHKNLANSLAISSATTAAITSITGWLEFWVKTLTPSVLGRPAIQLQSEILGDENE